jgi:hypothetical protein
VSELVTCEKLPSILRTLFGVCATVAPAATCASVPLDDLVEKARPRDEAALLVFDYKASREYSAAPNSIIQEQVMNRWDKAFCLAVNKVTTFTKWTGHVNKRRVIASLVLVTR